MPVTPPTARRNDPCPCGSGRKYKRCCAGPRTGSQTRPPTMVPEWAVAPRGEARPCGDCSACCDGWLRTRVLGHDIDVGKPCPFSSGHHCTIHPDRPEHPCRVFFCGWAEPDSPLPDWMQPSRCGVIVLTGRSRWRGRPVDVLVSAWKDPDEQVLAWYRRYSRANRRPFLYQEDGRWYGFGPSAFQEEMAEKAARGDPLWT